jgi:hypothetical protein
MINVSFFALPLEITIAELVHLGLKYTWMEQDFGRGVIVGENVCWVMENTLIAYRWIIRRFKTEYTIA